MAVKSPWARKSLSLLGAVTLRLLRSTIDWRALYFDPKVDPVQPHPSGRFVVAGRHEVMGMPIALRGQRSMLALASEHGDGEIITRRMRHLGWSVLQGSTSRGGVAVLLRMRRDDGRHLNFTP